MSTDPRALPQERSAVRFLTLSERWPVIRNRDPTAGTGSGQTVAIIGRGAKYSRRESQFRRWRGTALIALLNEQLGKHVGLVNNTLCAKGASGMRDITSGTNGAYQPGTGWDACTGLGSPNGQALLAALKGK
jgi:hypothetical protein